MKHPPPEDGGVWLGFRGGALAANCGWQVRSAFLVNMATQPHPVHVEKNDVRSAAAVSTTGVPTGNCAWHTVPQSIPAGEDRTTPSPVPPLVIVRVRMAPISWTVRLDAAATYAVVPRGCMATPIGRVPTDGIVVFTAPFDAMNMLTELPPRFAT